MRGRRSERIPDLLAAFFLPDGPVQHRAELRLFQHLRLPNGTAKTTFPDRLRDLDELVVGLMAAGRKLSILDAGASSALTSLDWHRRLSAAGVEHEMVASDLLERGWLSSLGWSAGILFDGNHRPLLLEVGRHSLPLVTGGRRRALIVAALPLLRAFAVIARALPRSEPGAPPRRGRWVHRELELVSRAVRRNAAVTVIHDDLTVPGRLADAFDVVRAANIVTPIYFDQPTLHLMLDNLARRVRDGGLLVLCGSVGDANHASIFRRRRGAFTPIARLGDGSEVESLVVSAAKLPHPQVEPHSGSGHMSQRSHGAPAL